MSSLLFYAMMKYLHKTEHRVPLSVNLGVIRHFDHYSAIHETRSVYLPDDRSGGTWYLKDTRIDCSDVLKTRWRACTPWMEDQNWDANVSKIWEVAY